MSVSDKDGLDGFVRHLTGQHSANIISTGGTANYIRSLDGDIPVTDVSDITGFPEIMDGRVKTLHPKIHGGILARRDNDAHRAAMDTHHIDGIDMVVVNLYPFGRTVASGADDETAIENIDIGGPAMIRAAAKNHKFVTIVTDPADYPRICADMDKNGGRISQTLRRELAAKAFAHTAAYDAMIANYLSGQNDHDDFAQSLNVSGALQSVLRYGENPHQKAAFYTDGTNRPGIATAQRYQGKALSYNNLNDTDAAYELVAEFDRPAVAIIKHANPCGVATADTLAEAYKLALRCDPVSAFGGIVAVNRPLDAETAADIIKIFTELVIAPSIEEPARHILAEKKNMRVLAAGSVPDPAGGGMIVKSVAGGFLVQNRDHGRIIPADLKIVTKKQPTAAEMADMLFAFRVAKHVKSNAIVYAKDGATVGIGAGQMSRVDSTRIAAHKASEAAAACGLKDSLAAGSVVASDAFFPFSDGLIAAAQAGATAIIQPGGSIRDDDVIAAADEHGLAMVLTGMRHFRH